MLHCRLWGIRAERKLHRPDSTEGREGTGERLGRGHKGRKGKEDNGASECGCNGLLPLWLLFSRVQYLLVQSEHGAGRRRRGRAQSVEPAVHELVGHGHTTGGRTCPRHGGCAGRR